jgi:hypothetical protein
MFPDLYYNGKDGSVDKIGEWAGWFNAVGEVIGSSVEEKTRFILGMALPVRPFAAIFLSLGLIKGREIISDGSNSDNKSHFKYLESLPLATNVTFLINDKGSMKQKVGKLDGVLEHGGYKAIKVCYLDDKKNNAKCTKCFYIKDCLNVSVLSQDSTIDISNNRKKGRSIIKSKGFLSEVASNVDISVLAVTSRLDCLLIGTKRRLFFELEFDFSLKDKGKFSVQGTLKDIIRPQNNTLYSKSFRSLIHPVNLRKSPDANGVVPWIVIFDSADGYLKWHDLFQTSHQLILLDRTEKCFKEAAQHINQRYYRRTDSLPDFTYNLPKPLAGIELICFSEH